MPIRSFDDLIESARTMGPKRVALVAADQMEALQAASRAYAEGLAQFVLIGDAERIESLLAEEKLDLGSPEIIREDSVRRASQRGVDLARVGAVDLLMNGRAQPMHLIQIAVDPFSGLRTTQIMTDVAVFEIPGVDRLILVADVLVVPYPQLDEKMGIVQNAIDVAMALGVQTPPGA